MFDSSEGYILWMVRCMTKALRSTYENVAISFDSCTALFDFLGLLTELNQRWMLMLMLILIGIIIVADTLL